LRSILIFRVRLWRAYMWLPLIMALLKVSASL